MEDGSSDVEIPFRLPLPGWPRATFSSNHGYEGGRLVIGDATVASARTRGELERGLQRVLPAGGHELRLRIERVGPRTVVHLTVDGRPALREDELRARPSRSAWTHAAIALAASAAGFVASWLYLQKSATLQDPWALKMGNHMAGWHLLLTFSLFPASVWGQRTGIRVVQGVSVLFFCIHAGIAIANLGPGDADATDGWIALFNALSGLCFLGAVVYGNRAWRDMDPVEALRRGRTNDGRGPRTIRPVPAA